MTKSVGCSVGLVALLCAVTLLCALPAGADQASRVTPVVKAVRAVSPAVVNISTRGRHRVNPFFEGDEFFDRFFREFWAPTHRDHRSLGSGVIIDGQKGLIATNHHVIAAASEIRVQLADKRVFVAQVVGADPGSDLAVLRIRPKGPLPQVKLGNSDELMIGEKVIAIGNPFGLSHTVTTGVLSAIDRRVPLGRRVVTGLIQIDASINPGNSGGPLLNVDGEVIGINTAIFRRAQGIGFAIPVNRVRRIAADLVRYGEVIPAWLGLELQTITERLARGFGLESNRGVAVVGVMDQSPAAKVGIRRGMVIAALNGHPVNDISHYLDLLAQVRVGRSVTLRVHEGGEQRKIEVLTKAFPLQRANELAWRKLGLKVMTLSPELAQRHRVRPNSAVAIAEVARDSRAASFGLRSGDLLVAMGGRPTPNLKAFQREMAAKRLQPSITILVRRGRSSAHVTLGE